MWARSRTSSNNATYIHCKCYPINLKNFVSPCIAAKTQNVPLQLPSRQHLTTDHGSRPSWAKIIAIFFKFWAQIYMKLLLVNQSKTFQRKWDQTWHWNSLASWMLTRSHLWVEEALSLALCQSPWNTTGFVIVFGHLDNSRFFLTFCHLDHKVMYRVPIN